MGNQKPAFLSRQPQHVWIIQASKTSGVRRLKINAWFQTQSSFDDDLVQIGISLKPDFHEAANSISRRAFAILRENSASRTVC